MNEQENRHTKRKSALGAVELYDSGGTLLKGVGHLLNLSLTGSLVETSVRLVPGQVLRLRLQMTGHAPLDLEVTVARTYDKRLVTTYGIQFSGMTPDENERLKKFLSD